jgi:F-type H+-transporting ATPase subunit b
MGLNPWTFVLEALNFVALAFVLHRLLYRPLHAAIDARREAIARAQAEAEAAQHAARALQEQFATQLATIDAQRQAAMHQAQEQAAAERRRLLTDTADEAKKRREELGQALAHEREEAQAALRAELVEMALDVIERLLREVSDTTLHHHLARRLVDSLQRLPDAERERLRADWRAEDGAIVQTAEELDAAMVEQLRTVIATLVGSEVRVMVESKPALLAGIRVLLDGHVWDGSLAGQLERARRAVEEGAAHP